jgi:cell pole-organizing protein PopZ
MSQPAKAQEPSMEEILASIRRIIADDEGGKARAPEAPKPAPAAAPARPTPPMPQAAAAPKPAATAPRPGNQDEIDAMLSGIDTSAGRTPDDGIADVLNLTESMAAPAQQPPMFRTIDTQSDVFFSEESAEAAPAAPDMRRMAPPSFEPALMSSSTSQAVDAAFNTLAHTVLSQNARTLEDLVKEMMRPMLKAWLDDNLPGLVERVVRAEIERVSRGRN